MKTAVTTCDHCKKSITNKNMMVTIQNLTVGDKHYCNNLCCVNYFSMIVTGKPAYLN